MLPSFRLFISQVVFWSARMKRERGIYAPGYLLGEIWA